MTGPEIVRTSVAGDGSHDARHVRSFFAFEARGRNPACPTWFSNPAATSLAAKRPGKTQWKTRTQCELPTTKVDASLSSKR